MSAQKPSGRVCHLTSVHIPLDGRILYHECRSLAKEHEVSLVCFDDSPARRLQGVDIRPIGRRPSTRRARWALLSSLVKAAEELHPDVYHFHDPELIPWMRKLRARSSVPVVYDIHESYPEAVAQRAWIPGVLRPAIARMVGAFERRRVRSFDALVVADEALRLDFAPIHPLVVKVRNYPPLDLFPPRGPHRPEQRPTLFYSGSISLVRGLREMIEVIGSVRKRIPDARLVLAGKPTEDAVPVLNAALDEMPEGIEFLGPVPYERLGELLREASVGVSLLQPHPKYEKNVPTKVFDYMAASVPYVASSSAPLREITGGVGGALVTAGSSAEATAAALELLLDPDKATRTGLEGRSLAETDLNWAAEESELLALYRRLMP